MRSGPHSASIGHMHRYWVEDAGSSLADQMDFLRGEARNEASPDPADQSVDATSDHARLSRVYAEGRYKLAEGHERLSHTRSISTYW
jgi:hypothetical protein